MELRRVYMREQAFLLVGTLILLSFGNSEELDFSCNKYYNGVSYPSLNGGCCRNSAHCKEKKYCGGELAGKYCNITDPTIVCPVIDLPWFMCLDKKRCYPRQLKCDRLKHCEDGSDEIECDAGPLKNAWALGARASLTSDLETVFHHTTNKSGLHITKIALALSSSDRRLLKPNTKTRDEIAYELSLRLLTKLTLKKKISTYELSDNINALIVTCMNPRDFFGFNLVAELRKRVDQSNYTNPFTILTLCNARNTMVLEDVIKLQNLFYAYHRPLWTETQSLVTMALACISTHSSLQIEKRILSEMVQELKRKQLDNGTVEDLRTTALVIQALLATDSYRTEFDVRRAIDWMGNKVRASKVFNLQNIYYVLPVLNHMSLTDISSDHCVSYNETVLQETKNLQDFPHEYILVQFSFYIGEKKDFIKTWRLKVPDTVKLYHILEIVSVLEPKYKVSYTVTNKKPYVVGVGNFTEDAEAGEFWFIYKHFYYHQTTLLHLLPLPLEGNLLRIKESPVDVPVKANDELVLWYKKGDWYESIDTIN